MNRVRLAILILGPLPIVAGSISLARWARSQANAEPTNHVLAQVVEAAPRAQITADTSLTGACQQVRRALEPRLGAECNLLVRAPFVIAGDLSKQELTRWHEQTIGPASRAMANSYFRNAPNKPITILLFSGEQSYNHYIKQLFNEEGISVYGYYKPRQRTLVMNIATGGGTLVHELTHALIEFDFPEVPDWFNEGLASLHEQCKIRPDESGIDGLENWRLPGLKTVIEQGRLGSLADLMADAEFRGDQVGLNYAAARYFCLFLQRQGLLQDYYRWFRQRHANDPTGTKTVLELFPGKDWDDLDQEFQAFVLELKVP